MHRAVALRALGTGLFAMISAGCVSGPPADFRPAPLDLKGATRDADVIVLASPRSRRTIRRIHYRLAGQPRELQGTETETELRVIGSVKGDAPGIIKYRHIQDESPVLSGPPQGPSGAFGSAGIYFLRRTAGNAYRVFVDVYRSDINAGWIDAGSPYPMADDATDRVGTLLLTLRPDDDAQRFAACLATSFSAVMEISGFVRALRHLSQLAMEESRPEVRQAACQQLALQSTLAVPAPCIELIAKTASGGHYETYLAKQRTALMKRGPTWRENWPDTPSTEEPEFYRILSFSADPETRRIALSRLTRKE